MFNVRDYGATGNRQDFAREAIQTAIDACRDAGGGTVFLPAGDYESGGLELYSYVTLHLDAGATIWISQNPEDFFDRQDFYDRAASEGFASVAPLLSADNQEHISVVGSGTIHGQATADWNWYRDENPSFRTGIIYFRGCRQVTIHGVTILYSDFWGIHLERCDTVYIDRVTIRNNIHRFNSDGIAPNSCRNVHISNCHIVSGDDCIVLKADEVDFPCEDVVVTNCTLESPCTALKLGTGSFGDFRDIHFSNCTIRRTGVGIGLYVNDGATMERITFSNISIDTLPVGDPLAFKDWRRDQKGDSIYNVFPIFFDIQRRDPDSRLGKIRDVVLRDIQIASASAALIQGTPESHIENLTLQNITLRVDTAKDPSSLYKALGGMRSTPEALDTVYARQPSYVTLAHVSGVTLDNVRVLIGKRAFAEYERSAVYAHDVEDAVFRNVVRSPDEASGHVPVIDLHESQRVKILD